MDGVEADDAMRQQAAERLQQTLERAGEQAAAAGLDDEALRRLLADES